MRGIRQQSCRKHCRRTHKQRRKTRRPLVEGGQSAAILQVAGTHWTARNVEVCRCRSWRDASNGTAAVLVRWDRFFHHSGAVTGDVVGHAARGNSHNDCPAVGGEASGVLGERTTTAGLLSVTQDDDPRLLVFGTQGLKSLTLLGRKLVPFCRGRRPLLTCPFLPMDRYHRQRVPRE